MKKFVTDVSPASPRIQAVSMKLGVKTILLINSYFPTDTQKSDDLTELMTTLLSIQKIIEDNHFDSLIWTGDVNTDFQRKNEFTATMEHFIDEINILKAWDRFNVDFTHVHEQNGNTYTSTIDHFFWNETVAATVEEAGVLHLPGNTSDHCPIYSKFQIENADDVVTDSTQTNMHKNAKPSWKNATTEQKMKYADKLENLMTTLPIPRCLEDCKDVNCNDKSHRDACDQFMVEILSCMEKTAEAHIPIIQGKKNFCANVKKKIPMWNDEIKPFQDDAYFWHAVWQSAGRPLNCHLHNIMKRTRNLYHLHIRKNRRMQEQLKRNKLLECCLQGDRNIFDEVKKSRKCISSSVTSIDNVTEDIPSHFAKLYENLYNSVDDDEDLRKLEQKISSNINNTSVQCVERVTEQVLAEASKKLKAGKTDPILEITSDCIINAPHILFNRLSVILRSYLTHGHVSSFLLISTLLPLIKDKLGDPCVSKNYRSIAISSVILKLFDWVIILLFGEELKLHDLQFAYQPEVSTSMCSWMVVETIDFFTRNKSEVYACTMDMSKAFDRVKHSTLFQKLLDNGLPAVVIRFLMTSYKLQSTRVKWNNTLSKAFPIANGVKQGAVLSAILYCVYTNDLFDILKRKRYGCWIEGEYFGMIGYADDLFLLAPSTNALQEMLKSCDDYAEKHNLMFSTDDDPRKSKTKCMAFLKTKRTLTNLTLCKKHLPWVDTAKHLGNVVENRDKCATKQDQKVKRAQYIQSNNEIMQEFYYAHPKTKLLLNSIYNSHFTGSTIWDLFSRETVMIENTWSVSMRNMLKLHRQTHRYMIEPISDVRHIKFAFLKRFLRFTEMMEKSSKRPVRHLFETVKRDCRSTTGANLRRILNLVRRTSAKQITKKDLDGIPFSKLKPEDEWRIPIIKELLGVRCNEFAINEFERSEITEMLDNICTT